MQQYWDKYLKAHSILQYIYVLLKNADIVLCEDTRTTGFLLTQ